MGEGVEPFRQGLQNLSTPASFFFFLSRRESANRVKEVGRPDSWKRFSFRLPLRGQRAPKARSRSPTPFSPWKAKEMLSNARSRLCGRLARPKVLIRHRHPAEEGGGGRKPGPIAALQPPLVRLSCPPFNHKTQERFPSEGAGERGGRESSAYRPLVPIIIIIILASPAPGLSHLSPAPFPWVAAPINSRGGSSSAASGERTLLARRLKRLCSSAGLPKRQLLLRHRNPAPLPSPRWLN